LLTRPLQLSADLCDGEALYLVDAVAPRASVYERLEAGEVEAPVPAGRTVDLDATAIGPATERRLVDAEELGCPSEGHPACAVVRSGGLRAGIGHRFRTF
jgi:hypothetical protein